MTKSRKKVRVASDGTIDFTTSENMPSSMKKFRQSPEIEGFYRFVYENDLRAEAFAILDQISQRRKASKKKK